MNKSICCISSKKEWQECNQLCALVKDKTGITVSALTSLSSTVDYDVVVYIHSKYATEDAQVAKWLKEASDLNKTFVPVILGGNVLSNKILIYKYKGPNLRSSFLQLRKDDDFFELCKSLTSYVGKELSGDAYGAIVNFVFDVDCKIIKDGTVIAEVLADRVTPVTLYLGSHNLTYQPDIDNCLSYNEILEIKDLGQTQTVKLNFCKKLSISSDILCDVYQNDRLVTQLCANENRTVALIAGMSNIRFQSIEFPDIAKTITTKIGDNNEPINVKFTVDVDVLSDCSCEVYQDDKLLGTITENRREKIPFFIGKSKCNVTLKAIEFPDHIKEFNYPIAPKNNHLTTRFGAMVKILADTSCTVYQDNLLIGNVDGNTEMELFLFLGKSEIQFKSLDCPQYSTTVSVYVKESYNTPIRVSLMAHVNIKTDVDGVLKENGETVALLNAYKSHSLRLYKGTHMYHFEEINNPDNNKVFRLDVKYDRSLSFMLEKRRLLNRIEQGYISSESRERYQELVSERKILKELLWMTSSPDDNEIQDLRKVNDEIDAIVDKTLREKGIIDIMESLQMPVRNVISGLYNSAPKTVHELLTGLESHWRFDY